MHPSENHRAKLADIIELAHAARAGKIDLPRFLGLYFQDLDPTDLASRDAADWHGAAMAHLKLAHQRDAGLAGLRIYNPSFDGDGWQCTHTCIDLVNDDMPFLVDTVSLTLQRLGYAPHLIIHPVITVLRDQGHLDGLHIEGAPAESWMHLEIDRITDPARLAELQTALSDALAQLKACVEDWPAMSARLGDLIGELKAQCPKGIAEDEYRESLLWLEWLLADNFVFLGYRDYTLDKDSLNIVPETGLGILRDRGDKQQSAAFAALPAELKKLAHEQTLLLLTKTNSRATIHRAAYLDCVGIKRLDAKGKVIGERRFLGLYTATAYNTPPTQIPILRQKISQAMALSHFPPNSHKGKTLLNVLQTFPRDELTEISVPALVHMAQGIVNLQERNRVRVFVREDSYRRYISVMVFCPRDNYNTDVRLKMQHILLEALTGSSAEFNVMLSDSVLARIHFIVRIPTGSRPQYDAEELEKRIAHATRRWADDLQINLTQHLGEEEATRLFAKYHKAFPAAYFADYDPRTAVSDIEKLEASLQQGQIRMKLSGLNLTDPLTYRFKIFRESQIALSDSLPVLENMGVRVIDEQPYTLHFPDGSAGWITDIGLKLGQTGLLEDETQRERFQQGFAHIFNGQAENDSFNRLILLAGLDWRAVSILRAYSRYQKQVGLNISQDSIADCLARLPDMARDLARLFLLRHDPQASHSDEADALEQTLASRIAATPSLDDERVLTGLFGSIRATLRTNYFQTDAQGQNKPYLSFKVESGRVPNMPQPVPLFEIFVYSPKVEGVHLRGGKVARGGLRWSDRREDFRTEVLGLVKAQMVKNTVIVPVGSKGGFVVKQPPREREALQAEGINCYKTFIRGLLDLTDNLVEGRIVPPTHTVRLDADDPYLVVAADKGTATFSDIANSVSQEYGFWLDDAFASGGSAGYDHKKMGITARGAWESVKRQFREMGIDTQTQPFTCVGIGDLMGDVFGNGMLNSPCIQLVAAFNHLHIFLDPNPDPARTYAERQRMFALPRSSWEDYNTSLISEGGGIFPRSAKSIPLSPQVRAVLGVEDESLAPNDLIRAILKAPVDLLYNGGIGTYVKASTQSQAEANDRGNDALRINGNELRCKVVAEGGNLGFTQLGRVEYALQGGKIYTDAIDNSAGVDCSDHEVNIKILLTRLTQGGDMTLKQRNSLLADMTDNVGTLVLEDNYLQTEAISLEHRQGLSLLPVHTRFMQTLEKNGKLSRRIEYLPNDSQLQERTKQGQSLSQPELAVLLAYAKIALYQDLLAGQTVDAAEWDSLLTRYFPSRLGQEYGPQLPQHPLRREIVANELTNSCVNRMGITFVFRVAEETNASAEEIVRAWYKACELMQINTLWHHIEALDSKVDAGVQYDMLLEVRKQVERVTRWVLRLLTVEPEADARLHELAGQIPTLQPRLPQWLADNRDYQASLQRLVQAGVPEAIANATAYLDAILSLLNIARVAGETGRDIDDVALIHFRLDTALQLGWLRSAIERLPRDNRWQALARMAFRDELYREHSQLTTRVLQSSSQPAAATVDHWLGEREAALGHVARMFDELRSLNPDLAMLSAAMREIRNRLAA